jgi:thiamine-monophosphate kinase
VHFDLAYMPLKHLGYKAVTTNISDICAMNAKATQITVSVAVSNRFPLEALDELFDGLHVLREYTTLMLLVATQHPLKRFNHKHHCNWRG